jgi:hypothetical protein
VELGARTLVPLAGERVPKMERPFDEAAYSTEEGAMKDQSGKVSLNTAVRHLKEHATV